MPVAAEATGAEVPESGLGFIVAWVPGPAVVVRGRSPVRPDTVVTDSAGRRWIEPRTEADQRAVDESINEVLEEAGIPPRPLGFMWYLRIDADQLRQLEEAVNALIEAEHAVTPAEQHAALARRPQRWIPSDEDQH